jgi:hypothetical protein
MVIIKSLIEGLSTTFVNQSITVNKLRPVVLGSDAFGLFIVKSAIGA